MDIRVISTEDVQSLSRGLISMRMNLVADSKQGGDTLIEGKFSLLVTSGDDPENLSYRTKTLDSGQLAQLIQDHHGSELDAVVRPEAIRVVNSIPSFLRSRRADK